MGLQSGMIEFEVDQTQLQRIELKLKDMILATGGTDNTATQVTALIIAGASVVAYIIGEGLTDSANIGASDDAEEQ